MKIKAYMSDQTASAIQKVRQLFFPAWYLPNGTINATENKLESASDSCERWSICCGVLVLVSVAAEFIIDLIEPSYALFLRLSAITGAGVAIGIVGEVFFSMRDARIQTELRKRSNEQLASATKSAAQANERAAKANTKALEIEAELERLRTPRLLSEEQRKRITDKMRPFAGQQFNGAVTMGVSDAWTLWRLIVNTLREADWVLAAPSGQSFGDPPASIPVTARSGVGVMVPTGPNIMELVPRAQRLADALTAEGINAIWWPVGGSAVEATPNVIRIEIGPKT